MVRNFVITFAVKDRMPGEVWSRQRQSIASFVKFGSKVWVVNENPERTKIDLRGLPVYFVGLGVGCWGIRY